MNTLNYGSHIIYAVKHYYNNGESYEDYREYEDTFLFSTKKNASDFFWTKVTDDYEGEYVLLEWEADTQEKTILEESVFIACTPEYWSYDDSDDCQDFEDSNDCQDFDFKEYYDAVSAFANRDEYLAEEEWLLGSHEHNKLFKEMEEDKAIDELNASLDTLLNN